MERTRIASASALAFETQGGAFESGVIGNAWRTDGKAPLICALAKEIDLSKGFTLEAWVWLNYGVSGDERSVFECPGSVSCFVLGSSRSSGRIGFQISTDKGTFEAKTDDVLPFERWGPHRLDLRSERARGAGDGHPRSRNGGGVRVGV